MGQTLETQKRKINSRNTRKKICKVFFPRSAAETVIEKPMLALVAKYYIVECKRIL